MHVAHFDSEFLEVCWREAYGENAPFPAAKLRKKIRQKFSGHKKDTIMEFLKNWVKYPQWCRTRSLKLKKEPVDPGEDGPPTTVIEKGDF